MVKKHNIIILSKIINKINNMKFMKNIINKPTVENVKIIQYLYFIIHYN